LERALGATQRGEMGERAFGGFFKLPNVFFCMTRQKNAEKKLIVLKQEMETQKLSKSNVAEKIHTSHVASELRTLTIGEKVVD
jgi:hypothetical protein